jgi:DNA-binding IscR family transcriptional regulator
MLLRLATGGGHSLETLYHEQEATSEEAERILDCLNESGIVTRQGSKGFALAVAPEKLTIAEIVEAITPNLYAISPEEQDRVVKVLEPLFERLEAERRSLLSATLSDLKPG